MKEKQLDFLTKFQKAVEGGAIQPEEMASALKEVLSIVADLEKRMDATMETNKGEVSQGAQALRNDLSSLQARVEQLTDALSTTESKLTGESEQKVIQVFNEIKRIEQSIPPSQEFPSFDPIHQRITEVEMKIPTLKEVTPEEVRDKLETLEDEDRLDAKAIKNLPKSVETVIQSIGAFGGGGRQFHQRSHRRDRHHHRRRPHLRGLQTYQCRWRWRSGDRNLRLRGYC